MGLDFTALNTAISNLNIAINEVKTKVITLEDNQVTIDDQSQINAVAASVIAAVATLNDIIEGSLEAE